MASPCLNDLGRYIGQALDQIRYDGCEPALNRVFWGEYRDVRDSVSRDLVDNGIMPDSTEFKRLWYFKTLSRLYASGWRAFYNGDGYVEFYIE